MSRRPKPPVIVLRAGQPQKLVALMSARLRSGVLLPAGADPATVFNNRKCADRAITRTRLAAGKLTGTLLQHWAKLGPLSDSTPFDIVPLTTPAAKTP